MRGGGGDGAAIVARLVASPSAVKERNRRALKPQCAPARHRRVSGIVLKNARGENRIVPYQGHRAANKIGSGKSSGKREPVKNESVRHGSGGIGDPEDIGGIASAQNDRRAGGGPNRKSFPVIQDGEATR